VTKLNDESLEGALYPVKSQASEAPHRLLFRAVIPVEAHYSKKNSKTISYRWSGSGANRRRGSPFIRTTDKAAMAEQFLVRILSSGERFSSSSHPLCIPLFLLLKFKLDSFYTKKGEVNLRAGDLSNLIQGVEDSLQKADIIKDDALITKLLASKEFGLQNEIVIELFTNEDSSAKPENKKSKKPTPGR
jgi:hypothetical protein